MTALRERIAALSPERRTLLTRWLLRREPALVPSGEASPHGERLVAYYVAPQDAPPDDELRRFLSAQLPSYMVPAAFVRVPDLPRLPNGKIDRKALAARGVKPPTAPPPSAPSDDVVIRLLALWRETLGNPGLRGDEDFFEAGGDSILAIQLIARARELGVRLTLTEFLRVPTMSAMAADVRGSEPSSPSLAPDAPGAGPAALTPIQHWFMEQQFFGPDRWNQALSVHIPGNADHRRLEAALQAVIGCHDALRLALDRKAGGWQQVVKGTDTAATVPIVDLSALSSAAGAARIERETAALHASMRLDSGVLLRGVRFHALPGAGAGDLLLLVAHHLAVDAVSWPVLVGDLETAYQQIGERGEAKLPRPAVSFRQWSQALQTYAQRPELRDEVNWWQGAEQVEVPPLPRDLQADAPNDEQSAAVATVRLETAATSRLSGYARALRLDVRDLLLAAVIRGLRRWSGHARYRVGVEGHGRAGHPDLDVSRTVGWFTSYFPVVFELGEAVALDDIIRKVSETMRAVPDKGFGYGLLKYLTVDADVTGRLTTREAPELIVNYLGVVPPTRPGGLVLNAIAHGAEGSRHPLARRPSVFEVNARAIDGGLEIAWTYSRNLHQPDTIARLSRDLLADLSGLAASGPAGSPGRFTPSDFPDADLDQDDLDRLMDRLR